jgi:hypothetical protein
MKIKESEIRELYKKEIGIDYYKDPMKYMTWKKKRIFKLMEENDRVDVIRDDPESYPDKSKRIAWNRAIW